MINFASTIPPFNDNSFLPPGVHPATLDEIAASFGRQSEIRGVQMQSIRWMVDLAIRAGVLRVVLNGSFVTDIIEPNDVDCVLLVGHGFPKDQQAEAELRAGLPFQGRNRPLRMRSTGAAMILRRLNQVPRFFALCHLFQGRPLHTPVVLKLL